MTPLFQLFRSAQCRTLERVGDYARPSVARGALNAHFRRLARLALRYDELQSADRVTIAIQLSENQDVLSARRNLWSSQLVELNGIEPMTSSLQSSRSPN